MHEAIASGHPELEGKRPPRIPLGSSFSGLKLVRHDTSTPQDPPGLLSPNHTEGVDPGVRQASSLQQTNSTPRIQRIITLGKIKSTTITIDTDSMEDGSSRDLCFSLWPAPRDHFSRHGLSNPLFHWRRSQKDRRPKTPKTALDSDGPKVPSTNTTFHDLRTFRDLDTPTFEKLTRNLVSGASR